MVPASTKDRKRCEIVRVPKLEEVLESCGAKVIHPIFRGVGMKYFARVVDTKEKQCQAAIGKAFADVRITRYSWELAPWKTAERDARDKPGYRDRVPGKVIVVFKDRTVTDGKAQPIINKYGALFDGGYSGSKGYFVAVVPLGCENAFSVKIGRHPSVDRAYPQWIAGPQ